MNDIVKHNVSARLPRTTIGGQASNNNEQQLSRVRTKLARLSQLHTELITLCTTIEGLSTDLVQEMKDAKENETQHRYLGDETRHLVYASKKIDKACDTVANALRLVRDCVSLRCNDSSMTYVCYYGFIPPVDYGSVLSDCLRYNTCATELTLHLDTMVKRNHDYDATTETTQQQLKYLLRYIKHSTTLRHVNVCGSSDDNNVVAAPASEMTLASYFLDAIGQSRWIDELHWNTYIPPLAFYNAMVTTTSVKTLIIECTNEWHNYSHTERSMFHEAFTQNQSVVHLEVHSGKDNDWTMTEAILCALSLGAPNNNPPLQYLCLVENGRDDQLRHLIPFLQSTTTLKHLELRDFYFLGEHMNTLVHGLHLHYSGATAASITKLSLTGRSFDDEAAAAFIQYMQTPIPSGTDGTHQHGSVLQELHINVTGFDEIVTEFAGVPLGSAMVSLVTAKAVTTTTTSTDTVQPRDRQQTIGSQLRLLSVDSLNNMEGFCDTMKSQAMNIRLPRLHLAPFETKECSELPQWLPYVTSLEHLHISAVKDEVDPNLIIVALQQSQSLRSVTVIGWTDNDGRRYLNESNARRIESICQRNQILFKLLSRRTQVKWNIGCDSSQHRNKRRKVRDAEVDNETLLLPSLFQAAKHMPQSRASTIIASLLLLEIEFC